MYKNVLFKLCCHVVRLRGQQTARNQLEASAQTLNSNRHKSIIYNIAVIVEVVVLKHRSVATSDGESKQLIGPTFVTLRRRQQPLTLYPPTPLRAAADGEGQPRMQLNDVKLDIQIID